MLISMPDFRWSRRRDVMREISLPLEQLTRYLAKNLIDLIAAEDLSGEKFLCPCAADEISREKFNCSHSSWQDISLAIYLLHPAVVVPQTLIYYLFTYLSLLLGIIHHHKNSVETGQRRLRSTSPKMVAILHPMFDLTLIKIELHQEFGIFLEWYKGSTILPESLLYEYMSSIWCLEWALDQIGAHDKESLWPLIRIGKCIGTIWQWWIVTSSVLETLTNTSQSYPRWAVRGQIRDQLPDTRHPDISRCTCSTK